MLVIENMTLCREPFLKEDDKKIIRSLIPEGTYNLRLHYTQFITPALSVELPNYTALGVRYSLF